MNQISFNTQQAAIYLNEKFGIPITRGTLEVWRSQGRGPRYCKVARWVTYLPKDLDQFAAGKVINTIDSIETR